jgi:clan AA aspartic protease (TIGR02281 family)
MKRMLCVLLLLPGISWATTYKCVDKDKVTYSSNPCGKDAQVMRFHGDQDNSQEKLEVRMDASHSYRTPGTVNGRHVTFVIDTGASRTAISQQVADAAGLKGCSNASYAATANGMVVSCQVTVPEITFGTFHVRNLVVAIMPSMPVDALLGMDVLGRMKIQQEYGVLYISGQ